MAQAATLPPTGGADILMESGTSFTEGAGTTSGTKPGDRRRRRTHLHRHGRQHDRASRGIEHAERQPRRRTDTLHREHLRRARQDNRGRELHQRRHDQTDQRRRLRQQRNPGGLGGHADQQPAKSSPNRRTAGLARYRATSPTPARSRSKPTPAYNATGAMLHNRGTINIANGITFSTVTGGRRSPTDPAAA